MEVLITKSKLKNFIDGMTSIEFPVFYTNQSYENPKKAFRKSRDVNMLRMDYKKSTKDIKKGLIEFEQSHPK